MTLIATGHMRTISKIFTQSASSSQGELGAYDRQLEGQLKHVPLTTVQEIAVVLAVTFEIGMQSGRKSLLDVYKGKYRQYTMTLYRGEVQRDTAPGFCSLYVHYTYLGTRERG